MDRQDWMYLALLLLVATGVLSAGTATVLLYEHGPGILEHLL